MIHLSLGPSNVTFLSCMCIAHLHLIFYPDVASVSFSFPTSCSGFLLIVTAIESLCSAVHSSELGFFDREAALHCSGNEKRPQ